MAGMTGDRDRMMMTYYGASIDAYRDELEGWIDMTYNRKTRDLCGDCWTAANPTDYLPMTGHDGICAECGSEYGDVYRSRIDDETCVWHRGHSLPCETCIDGAAMDAAERRAGCQ